MAKTHVMKKLRVRRSFISRSETRPFLKVRHESFVGVDGTETTSKTKTQASTTYVGLYPQNKTIFGSAFRKKQTTRTRSKARRKALHINTRLLVHSVIIGLSIAVVSYCGINASNASSVIASNSDVQVASEDPATTLAAGAIIARSVDALIGEDVAKKANDTTNQVNLATSGDNYLAKKQPIVTAGSPTRDIITYNVAGGDTLSSIAQKFNITSNTILWANNLADEATIKPGQALTILPTSGVLYTVSAGDTAAAIAAKYQANASLIESYNNLSGDPLAAGIKLIVPDGVVPTAPRPPVPARPALLASAFAAAPSVSFRGGANSYSYGYCTWYVANRRAVPGSWGNASSWYYNAAASGYGVGSAPRAGAIASGSGNHVAYVESVSGGMVTVSEMNYWGGGGGWNRVSRRTVPASTFRYIY